MTYFWSSQTHYIGLFSWEHFFYFGIFFSCLIALLAGQRTIKTHKILIKYILLGLSIFQQLLLYSWYVNHSPFPLDEGLPLHISRISSLLGIFYLLSGRMVWMNYLAYFSSFAYLSFLVPSNIQPPHHALGISFVINHVLTILLPLFAYLVDDWQPSLSAKRHAYFGFCIYLLCVSLINPIVDGNYFYLRDRPLPFLIGLPFPIYLQVCLLFTWGLFTLYHRLFDYFLIKANPNRFG